MWSESWDCHQHQDPGAGLCAALYSCSGPVSAFLKLINSIASLFPWEIWSADLGPHWFPRTPDATLGLYFYFRSGLLTWLRSVNQLAKCCCCCCCSQHDLSCYTFSFLSNKENILESSDISPSLGGKDFLNSDLSDRFFCFVLISVF